MEGGPTRISDRYARPRPTILAIRPQANVAVLLGARVFFALQSDVSDIKLRDGPFLDLPRCRPFFGVLRNIDFGRDHRITVDRFRRIAFETGTLNPIFAVS
jgi:hypothetical protein